MISITKDIIVATVLTVYGIETLYFLPVYPSTESLHVATVLTVYGIETKKHEASKGKNYGRCNSAYRLRY